MQHSPALINANVHLPLQELLARHLPHLPPAPPAGGGAARNPLSRLRSALVGAVRLGEALHSRLLTAVPMDTVQREMQVDILIPIFDTYFKGRMCMGWRAGGRGSLWVGEWVCARVVLGVVASAVTSWHGGALFVSLIRPSAGGGHAGGDGGGWSGLRPLAAAAAR